MLYAWSATVAATVGIYEIAICYFVGAIFQFNTFISANKPPSPRVDEFWKQI